MTKLTKHNSFKSLKLSSRSNTTTSTNSFVPLPELEVFFNLLRQKLIKTPKTKNVKP